MLITPTEEQMEELKDQEDNIDYFSDLEEYLKLGVDEGQVNINSPKSSDTVNEHNLSNKSLDYTDDTVPLQGIANIAVNKKILKYTKRQ